MKEPFFKNFFQAKKQINMLTVKMVIDKWHFYFQKYCRII